MKPHPIPSTMPCRYFGVCGGCDSQDIPYPEQLKIKEARVKEMFSSVDAGSMEDIVPSPEIFYYRNKMEYAVSGDNGEALIGLRQKKRFYRTVDLEECPIFFDGVSDVFKVFKAWMKKNDIEPYQLRRHSGSVRYAAMRHSKRYNELMVIAVMARAEATIGELVDGLDKIEAVKSVYMCVNDAVADVSTAGRITLMSGQEHIKENINGIDYLVGPDSFFQTNPYCCDRLYGVIKERTKGVGGTALDMCCGSGGITLQVAGNFDKVIGVDISAKNIENALLNARINKRDNVEFVCQDAEKFVPGENLSTIILDPPRAGLGKKAKKWVLESGVENVVYVSCNPVNLAQDLTALKEAYKIKSLIPVDMFPHTRHLEVVAILKRDKV